MKLNLGSAERHVPGYLCVDIFPPKCDTCGTAAQTVDLALLWPWPENSIDAVQALDVIEHVGDLPTKWLRWPWPDGEVRDEDKPWRDVAVERLSKYGRIHFMNELWRCLKPGGIAVIDTPNAAKGVGFYQDCTHVSPFVLSSWKYFEHQAFARERLGDSYGIKARFRVQQITESRSNGECAQEEVWKMRVTLEAVKP